MLKSEISSKSLRILHKLVSLRECAPIKHTFPPTHDISHVRCVVTTVWHINQYNRGTIYSGQHPIPLAENSILKTTFTSNTNYSFQVVTFMSEPLTINSRPWWCNAWAVSFVWKVMMVKKTSINDYGFIIKDTTQEQATCRDAYDRKGWVSMLSLGTLPSSHGMGWRT